MNTGTSTAFYLIN